MIQPHIEKAKYETTQRLKSAAHIDTQFKTSKLRSNIDFEKELNMS